MFYKTGLLSRGLTIERGLTFQYLRYICSQKKIRFCHSFPVHLKNNSLAMLTSICVLVEQLLHKHFKYFYERLNNCLKILETIENDLLSTIPLFEKFPQTLSDLSKRATLARCA